MYYKKSLMAVCASAVLLSGCSFKPVLPRKDTSFTADYKTSNISDMWWRSFNDQTLNNLINQALINNSDLALALNNLEYARVSLGLSKLDYLPNVGYSFNAKRQNNYPMGVDANSHGSYTAGFNLNYELDLWGRVRNSVGAAKSKFLATKYDYDAARLSLASNVADMYFSLLSLKEQEEILQNTLKSYNETLNFRQKQLNAGAISDIVFYQTKAQVDSAKSQLINVQNELSKTNTALSILVGKNYDEILHKNINVSSQMPSVPSVPSGIPSDVLLHRADVASALESLKASNFLVGARKAEYFPTISLTGMLGYASGEFDRLFTQNANSWNIGGSLVGPLLDFGRTAKKVELANLDQNASFIKYDKTLKTAFGEVRDALENRKNSIKEQASMKELVNSQTKVYNMAKQRYDEGYSDHLELLDARRSLLSAKLNLAKANYSVLDSVVGVYKALGGGFNLEDNKTKRLIQSHRTISPNNYKNPFSK